MNKSVLGHWGEEQAARFLRKKGYRIIAMNFSCRMGEIDIIASKKSYIVFVEVKLRKNAGFAQAREYVSRAKQERIKITAMMWLGRNETELQPRFDVIEIYAPEGAGGKLTINHIEDAFS